jgi:hypothetical protein
MTGPRHVPLERLRQWRVTSRQPDIAGALTRAIDQEVRQIGKALRATGGIEDAWARVVPASLRARATPERLRAGVLTVRVTDGVTMHEVDRWLRAGGERALKQAAGTTLTRVRVTVR